MALHRGPQRRTYGKKTHHRLFQECDYGQDVLDAGTRTGADAGAGADLLFENAGTDASIGVTGLGKSSRVIWLKGSNGSLRLDGSRRKAVQTVATERGDLGTVKGGMGELVVEQLADVELGKGGGGGCGDIGDDDNDITFKLGSLNLGLHSRRERSGEKLKKVLEKERLKNVKEVGTKIKSGPLKERDANIVSVPSDGFKKGYRKARGSHKEDQKEQLIPTPPKITLSPQLKSPYQVRSKRALVRKYNRSGSEGPVITLPMKSTKTNSTACNKTKNATLLPDYPEPSHESAILTNSAPPTVPPFLHELTSHTTPLLSLATDTSARASPLPFSTWSDELSTYFQVIKIAEASYGEVYRLVLKANKNKDESGSRSGRRNKKKEETGRATTTTMATGESVIKIIPLDAPATQDLQLSAGLSTDSEDPMPSSSVQAVTSEVQLLRRMAPVPGFTNFRDVRVVYGRPGRAFIDAWRGFREEKLLPKGEESTFPDPGRGFGGGGYGSGDDGKGMNRRGRKRKKEKEERERQERQMERQLWAVIEMEDAGVDLEGCDVVGVNSGNIAAGDGDEESDKPANSVAEGDGWGVFGIWDVFWGVASALAKGEKEARFEV